MDLTAPLPQKIIDRILSTIRGHTLAFVDDAVISVFAELARRHGLTPKDESHSCWTFAVASPKGRFSFDLRSDLSIIIRSRERGNTPGMDEEIAALEQRLDALRHEWMIAPLDPQALLSETTIVPPQRQRPSSLAERASCAG